MYAHLTSIINAIISCWILLNISTSYCVHIVTYIYVINLLYNISFTNLMGHNSAYITLIPSTPLKSFKSRQLTNHDKLEDFPSGSKPDAADQSFVLCVSMCVCVCVCVWKHLVTRCQLFRTRTSNFLSRGAVNLIPSTAQRRRWFEIVISSRDALKTYLLILNFLNFSQAVAIRCFPANFRRTFVEPFPITLTTTSTLTNYHLDHLGQC